MEFAIVLSLVVIISAALLLFQFFSGSLIGADEEWRMVKHRRPHGGH
jgi:hypothetical protein